MITTKSRLGSFVATVLVTALLAVACSSAPNSPTEPTDQTLERATSEVPSTAMPVPDAAETEVSPNDSTPTAVVELMGTEAPPVAIPADGSSASPDVDASTFPGYDAPVQGQLNPGQRASVTWMGKAGDVIRFQLMDNTSPLRVVFIQPSGGQTDYLDLQGPYTSDPIPMLMNGTYTLTLQAPADSPSSYQMQLEQLTIPVVPKDELTELKFDPALPYFAFEAKAFDRINVIAASEDGLGFSMVSAFGASGTDLKTFLAFGYTGETSSFFTGPHIFKITQHPEGMQSFKVYADDLSAGSPPPELLNDRNYSLNLGISGVPRIVGGLEDNKLLNLLSIPDCQLTRDSTAVMSYCLLVFSGKKGEQATVTITSNSSEPGSPYFTMWLPSGGVYSSIAPDFGSTQREANRVIGPFVVPEDGLFLLQVGWADEVIVEKK